MVLPSFSRVISPDPTIHRQVVETARVLLRRDPETPIRRIADQAGVSRATFYRHFGSRDALLSAVAVARPTPTRERVLATAAELIGAGGLHGFTMEQLASGATVSRATVYRLFPTKAALFGELVRHYSPFRPGIELLEAHRDDPPSVVVPLMIRAFGTMAAPRFHIMRGVILEATAATPDAIEGLQPLMPEWIGAIGSYLARQMEAGRIRRMHPFLAVQAVLGPLFLHLMTRPIAERIVGFEMPIDEVADQLSAAILEGMAA
jgi:AcrR family transcriptional regulator